MKPITIAHLFPDLLNLYGDGGNVLCLKKRCEWRGLPVELVPVRYGEAIDFDSVDLVFLGGGPDREQSLAAEQLMAMKDSLRDYVENNGVLLAICGGYQLLGKEWLLGSKQVEGLGILDIETKRGEGKTQRRLIADIALKSELCSRPVIGYENHAGRTFLGEGLKPFGKVVSSAGSGNNETDKEDGILYKHVLGTYLHGTLLGKNPQVADVLLGWISEVRAEKGEEGFSLAPLDDSIEDAANSYMAQRLGL